MNATHPNGRYGILARAFEGDPRLSRQQMDALELVCRTDAEARVLGLNEKRQPVVRARVGTPKSSRKWAILRNGDPTDAGKVVEVWHTGPHIVAARRAAH